MTVRITLAKSTAGLIGRVLSRRSQSSAHTIILRFTYDETGNLIMDGTNMFVCDVENRLVGRANGGVTLSYDPLGRLLQVSSTAGPTTQFR